MYKYKSYKHHGTTLNNIKFILSSIM